ncbi:MAG: helix-turn-helix transcriptional regulator [Cellulomonas sp.]|nr:helix-turn-helix transcriptional regulator [Cellulomonas sp.]MCR6647765.1 helix-turn-helix transcriptional regulator [Cellulomonas sp.]
MGWTDDRERRWGSHMHAWSRFVREYLDVHGMRPAELARKTGVSPQVLSNLLNDRRDHLDRRPDPKTVALLARGMNVDESVLLSKIGEAMGLPVAEHVVVYSASRVSDDELIRELAARLRKRGETGGNTAPTSGAASAAPEEVSHVQMPGGRPAEYYDVYDRRVTGDDTLGDRSGGLAGAEDAVRDRLLPIARGALVDYDLTDQAAKMLPLALARYAARELEERVVSDVAAVRVGLDRLIADVPELSDRRRTSSSRRVLRPRTVPRATDDDELARLITLNPAASEADGDEDPDAEVEEQQREP